MLIIFCEYVKLSGFVLVDLEVLFGMGGIGLFLLMEFLLLNGVKMEVVGCIDCVDKVEDENGMFLCIIDYKLSLKVLDLMEVYYGLVF